MKKGNFYNQNDLINLIMGDSNGLTFLYEKANKQYISYYFEDEVGTVIVIRISEFIKTH